MHLWPFTWTFFSHLLSSWISLSSNVYLFVLFVFWFLFCFDFGEEGCTDGCCILQVSFMFENLCLFYLIAVVYLVSMHISDADIIVSFYFFPSKLLRYFPMASVTGCYCGIMWDHHGYLFPLMVIYFAFFWSRGCLKI